MKKSKMRGESALWFRLFSTTFLVLLLTTFLFGSAIILLFQLKVLSPDGRYFAPSPLILLMFISLIIGSMITIFVSRAVLHPVEHISRALRLVSKGDFSIQLKTDSKITQISEMYHDFNLMVKELNGIETLRTDFVVNVSHEFKTPLAAIEGYATLLQNKKLTDEKREEYLQRVIDNTRRLSGLTGNILKLSRLENQSMITNKTYFSLDEQIRQTIVNLENLWEVKNIDFDIDLPTAQYYGNSELLGQVFHNLIQNAIKFSHQNGKIAVSLTENDNSFCIKISDNGIGINSDELKHIFEKFYQCNKNHRDDGNGLGLALVNRILKLCDGTISVKSELNKGTTFTVGLPKVAQEKS